MKIYFLLAFLSGMSWGLVITRSLELKNSDFSKWIERSMKGEWFKAVPVGLLLVFFLGYLPFNEIIRDSDPGVLHPSAMKDLARVRQEREDALMAAEEERDERLKATLEAAREEKREATEERAAALAEESWKVLREPSKLVEPPCQDENGIWWAAETDVCKRLSEKSTLKKLVDDAVSKLDKEDPNWRNRNRKEPDELSPVYTSSWYAP